MLVILNGMSGTSQLKIAMAVSIALNNFSRYNIGGYIVDFTKRPIEVYDRAGILVHRYNHDNTEGVDTLSALPNGQFTIDAINNFEKEQIINANKMNHLYDSFFNDFDSGNESYDGNVNDIITAYKNKKTKVHVISGIFSKSFIEKMQKELGKQNVTICNIIRNPSISFLYDEDPIVETKMLEEFGVDDVKIGILLCTSILSAIELSKLDYVKTVRFEDLIATNTININNKDIELPMCEAYNSFITKYEKEQLQWLATSRKDSLNKVNEIFSNLRSYNSQKDLPNNLFQELGYEPMTYDQITQ